jgi:DNA polymerase III delta prime subunit
LGDIGQEIEERLAQSLHNAVWLTLGLEQQNFRVQRSYAAQKQANQPAQSLPEGTRVLEVFEQMQRKLLILGEPGSGKTTMLLELAQDLFKQAKADNQQPIPVLVNLSSWQDPTQPIFDWLLSELKLKYGLRVDLATEYLQKNQLLPLLDGLDEVATGQPQACARAINDWMRADLDCRPCGMAVCCRREEYELGVRKPLSLYGAIYLQPLTPGQITDYFEQSGLGAVDATVRQDIALQDLLTTPLFLSVFSLLSVQGKLDLGVWQAQATSPARITYLFDAYWETMMERVLIIDPHQQQSGWLSRTYGKRRVPNQVSVRRSLVFSAKGLKEKTELLIEHLQPTWLFTDQQKSMYRFISILLMSLTASLIALPVIKIIDTWLLGILISLLIYPKARLLEKIEPVEKILTSISHEMRGELIKLLIKNLSRSIGLSVFFVVTTTLLFGIKTIYSSTLLALIFSFMFGSVESFIAVLKADKTDIQIQDEANQGIKNSRNNMLLIVVGSSLTLLIPLSLLAQSIRDAEIINAEIVLSNFPGAEIVSSNFPEVTMSFCVFWIWRASQKGGGQALFQHIALRLVFWRSGYAPPRYDLFLDYCKERLLLQRSVGRYRFMHRLLQDHFAAMDLEKPVPPETVADCDRCNPATPQ